MQDEQQDAAEQAVSPEALQGLEQQVSPPHLSSAKAGGKQGEGGMRGGAAMRHAACHVICHHEQGKPNSKRNEGQLQQFSCKGSTVIEGLSGLILIILLAALKLPTKHVLWHSKIVLFSCMNSEQK